jgi:hypothetical protein
MPAELVRHPHVITGRPSEVRAALHAAARSGRLISASRLYPVGHGLVRSEVVLLQPAQSAADVRVWLRRHRAALVLSASAVGALAVLGYVLAVLLAWVVAHAAVLIGSGVVLIVAAGVVRRIGRPSGHNGMGWHYTKCGR